MEALRLLGGRYRLEDQIGSGGMSVVWRATDEVLRRPVAVKVLAGRLAADPGARLRIQSEARAAARLSHPHVCGVYDFGESVDESGRPEPFVVMELLRGPTLSQRIADGPLPAQLAMRVCAEVASGIAAAHDAGLVHRDIKPANVILTTRGAKVVDFGIAAAAGPLEDLDQDDRMIGTPAYLAPERLTGDQVVPASDVYALGLLLHYVLVGKLPWAAETTTQMLRAHTYAEPEPLPPVSGVPAEVADLCGRCLAKDPADRPTATEVAEVLAAAAGMVLLPGETSGRHAAAPVLDAAEAGPAPDDQPTVEPAAVRRRQRMLAVGVVTATVVATAVVAVLIAGAGGDPTGALAEQVPDVEATGTPGAVTPPGGGDPSTGGPGQPAGPAATTGGVTSGPAAPITGVPTGGPPTTPGSSPTVEQSPDPTPDGTTRTLASAGGTVEVRCEGRLAHALSWSAADGYTVGKTEPGPAGTVHVWFEGPERVHMKIQCKSGVPSSVS
ncbi:protein kinase domain-containing protein [Phytohabitans sp. LJ34]|uniref:serine/threonine-protein kinase n=1 Tax=Phytohabitans sp. LJ34 TaxID=3452217 RepID=UPI003F8896C0